MKLHFEREPLDFSKKFTQRRLDDFVDFILEVNDEIGFKVSSRGWGYILEQKGFITKSDFDKVENLINKCRKQGLLPVDFIAEESARAFDCVHEPSTDTIDEHLASWINTLLRNPRYYSPDWWEGEKYYIQMIVEKIDLVTLFKPICSKYHIPIANAKGWSSISQRAEYARRFKDAEDKGLKCVLLYCGDHDPDGLRISDTLRKNLYDVSKVYWEDGQSGYNPNDLQITRFGLNYKFIQDNNLTWIDNLITGSGKNLASPNHPNHHLPYLTKYLSEIGVRKCEANALVTNPNAGRELCENVIQNLIGFNALARFKDKEDKVRAKIKERMEEIGLTEFLNDKLDDLEW